jgi:RNA polymerase sigma factor (sigma-70 family)
MRTIADELADRELLELALASLPERERRIVIDRLNDETLSSVGKSVGLSRDRVRVIQKDAIRKLARWLRWHGMDVRTHPELCS